MSSREPSAALQLPHSAAAVAAASEGTSQKSLECPGKKYENYKNNGQSSSIAAGVAATAPRGQVMVVTVASGAAFAGSQDALFAGRAPSVRDGGEGRLPDLGRLRRRRQPHAAAPGAVQPRRDVVRQVQRAHRACGFAKYYYFASQRRESCSSVSHG